MQNRRVVRGRKGNWSGLEKYFHGKLNRSAINGTRRWTRFESKRPGPPPARLTVQRRTPIMPADKYLPSALRRVVSVCICVRACVVDCMSRMREVGPPR